MFARMLTLPVLVLSLGAALSPIQLGAVETTEVDESEAVRSLALQQAQALSHAFATVAEQVGPAVVHIQVTSKKTVGLEGREGLPFMDPRFREMLPDLQPRQPRERRQQGQGSGFFISADGYILTNHHVVEDAVDIIVTNKDGDRHEATLVGSDPQSDVAVIKVVGTDFPYLPLGRSGDLAIGEWVLAVGSPFGLSQTVTAGIVSATGRNRVGILGADGYENFIQTDAAINPGNSGGPLVNLKGQVIGINTAIFSRSGGYMGIGFAIPMDMASPIKQQLIASGSVQRGFLGVRIQDLSDDLRQALGVAEDQGILISEVGQGSPAAAGGLEVGDVVIAYRGQPVEEVSSFRNRVAMTAPRTEVALTVLRNGEQHDLRLTLGTLPGQDERLAVATAPQPAVDSLGLRLGPVTEAHARALGVDRLDDLPGVMIEAVAADSAAAEAGLSAGMVIQRLGRVPVTSVRQAQEILTGFEGGDRVAVLVRDRNGPRFLGLVVPSAK